MYNHVVNAFEFFFSEYGRYLEDALNSVEPKVFVKMFLVTIHLAGHWILVLPVLATKIK